MRVGLGLVSAACALLYISESGLGKFFPTSEEKSDNKPVPAKTAPEAKAKTPPVVNQKTKFHFIGDDIIELAKKDPTSILAYELANHPEFQGHLTPELEKAKNLYPADRTKIILDKEFPADFKVKDVDVYFSEDPKYSDTALAYKIGASPTNPTIDELIPRYALANPNKANSEGRIMNPRLHILDSTVDWAFKKENADTKVAAAIGKRLKEEQLTLTYRFLIRGKLSNTKLAREIAARDFSRDEKDIDHILSVDDEFSRGLASREDLKIERWMKYKMMRDEKMRNSETAYILAKNPAWFNDYVTIDEENFLTKGENYKTKLARGHAANPRYNPSRLVRDFADELALKDQNADFLLNLTSNPNYFGNLSDDALERRLQFVVQYNSKLSEGTFRYFPEKFLPRLTQLAIDNPSRSDLAQGLLARPDFQLSKNFTVHISDEQNLGSVLSLTFLKNPKCRPPARLLERIGNPRFWFMDNALSVNPNLAVFRPPSLKN